MFTSATTPTDAQVQQLIDGVVGDIEAATGEIPTSLYPAAKLAAELGAASLVELSFFPSEPDSAYDDHHDRYAEQLARLVAGVQAAGGDAPGDTTPLAQYSFPTVATAVQSIYPVYPTTYETSF
jgi:hypothetical protein